MAFNDLPIIDRASENSDLSENHILSILNQRAGFICRKENPDKGCDLDVELISKTGKSTGWKFAIQIKSCEEIKKIRDDAYVSFSFETSRLGYLLRRIPAHGYLMIFSVKESQCYYSHVSDIYEKLMSDRSDDEWKINKSVNIHIPINNVLNSESAKKIHESMIGVYENATLMQSAWGEKYNIPTITFAKKEDFDLRSPHGIVRFLTKYGLFLLSEYDVKYIYNLISHVSNSEIVNSKELLYISAIVYCEVGKLNDSKYYLSKVFRRENDYSEEEIRVINFYNNKVRFALGEIKSHVFLEFLNSFENIEQNEQNVITLNINSIFFKLLQIEGLNELPKSLEVSINDIFKKIDNSKLEEKVKWLLRVWNCENFGIYTGIKRHSLISEIKIRETLYEVVSLDEKRQIILSELSAQEFINKTLQEAKKFGEDNQEMVVSAHAMTTYVRNVINKEIDFFTYSEPNFDFDGREGYFCQIVNMGIAASQIFFDNDYLKESYTSLCQANELLSLAKFAYGYNLNILYNEEVLINNLNVLERELEHEPFNSVIKSLVEKVNQNKNEQIDGDLSYMAKLSDTQIETLAKYVLKAYSLPQQRRTNLINEMKAYRLFYKRNKDSNIVLLQFSTTIPNRHDSYREATIFVLRSKITGIETAPNSDVEFLLNSWKL